MLKLGATIIGYEPPLVVYGILKPLIGEAYLIHLGAHISYPWFACDLALHFLGVFSVHASLLRVA